LAYVTNTYPSVEATMAGTPIKRARREAAARAAAERAAMGLPPLEVLPPVARAREADEAPRPPRELPALPSDADQATLAKRVLLDIAVNGGGPDAGARVGAAKALLEEGSRESEFLKMFEGDHDAAIRWLVENYDRLLGTLRAEAAFPEPEGSE
jgi:hypothetical protein